MVNTQNLTQYPDTVQECSKCNGFLLIYSNFIILSLKNYPSTLYKLIYWLYAFPWSFSIY